MSVCMYITNPTIEFCPRNTTESYHVEPIVFRTISYEPMPADYDLRLSVLSGRLHHHYGQHLCYLPSNTKGQKLPSVKLCKLATHMIYISGRQWHVPTDILVIVRFGSLLCLLCEPPTTLASAPALCTKCWWRVRRKEAIQVPTRLLWWLLP